MTQKDIIRMAQEAGARDCANSDKWGILEISYESLERLVSLAVLQEREACAKFCEEQYVFYGHDYVFAAGIRARGEK